LTFVNAHLEEGPRCATSPSLTGAMPDSTLIGGDFSTAIAFL
jgi:hypothetical protein